MHRSGNGTYKQKVNRPSGVLPAKTLAWVSKSPLSGGVPISLIRKVMISHTPIVLSPRQNVSNRPAEMEQRPSASILVPIFEQDGMADMVLTRRSTDLRTHAGEVAFPGGKVEDGETVEQAAIREAYEEIGLNPATVEIQGKFISSTTLSSFMSVVAIVATIPKPVSYRLNPNEVEKVFSFPISYLFQAGVHSVENWPWADGGQYEMHFFDFGEDLVWGATARILYEFMRTMSEAAMAQ